MIALLLPAIARAQEVTPTATPLEAIELPERPAEDPRFAMPVTDLSEPASDDAKFLLGDGIPRARGIRPTNRDALAMISVPAGCVAIGGGAWTGLAMHTGDAGTPALEMGAGYAGAWVGAVASVGTIYLLDRDAFTPDPNRALGGMAVPIGIGALAVPLAAGSATFLAGEELEGRSRHREEALAASIAGAALGELLLSVATWKLRTPSAQGPMIFAFIPVGAGSAIGYRLARGSSGREKPLMRTPVMLVVRF